MVTLSFRTAYQGKLFEYLSSEPRKKSVQNIEEMFETDFDLIFREDVASQFRDLDFLLL